MEPLMVDLMVSKMALWWGQGKARLLVYAKGTKKEQPRAEGLESSTKADR